MPEKLETKLVIDTYVQCWYPFRTPAIALSDCCRATATTTVFIKDGNRGDGSYSYRCEEHRGLIKGDEKGEVSETVTLKVED